MGRKIRTVSGLVSALLLVGVFVGTAVANHCAGCIDTSDLAGQSVTSGKIKDGTIQGKDIKTGSVGGRAIENGKVKAIDLHPSAMAAAGIYDLSGATTSTSATTLDSFTVTAPAQGVVWIQASGSYYVDLDAATAASEIQDVYFGVCTAADSLSEANCGDAGLPASPFTYYQDADDASSTNHTPYFSIARVVEVSKGANTFYFNARTGDASHSFNLYTNTRAVALFVPASLTIS